MRAGDVHNWTVWHGLPPVPDDEPVGGIETSAEGTSYLRYAEDMSRFVSEFGIQSAAARATLERWSAPEPLTLGGKELLHRVKSHPADKIDPMLVPVTGAPKDINQYFTYTQMLQAEGLKFGIEHYRRRMPQCSGTLIWQFNDCWPSISWSLIDCDNVRKASWHYVQRLYAPLIASFKQCEDGRVELWLSHTGTEAFDLQMEVSLECFDGNVLHEESLKVTAPVNASLCVWHANAKTIGAATDRYLRVSSPRLHSNRLFFAPFKDLPISNEPPRIEIRGAADGALEIDLSGTGYHVFVHFVTSVAGVEFSDNFFDLRRGEKRRILARLSGGELAPEDIRFGAYCR